MAKDPKTGVDKAKVLTEAQQHRANRNINPVEVAMKAGQEQRAKAREALKRIDARKGGAGGGAGADDSGSERVHVEKKLIVSDADAAWLNTHFTFQRVNEDGVVILKITAHDTHGTVDQQDIAKLTQVLDLVYIQASRGSVAEIADDGKIVKIMKELKDRVIISDARGFVATTSFYNALVSSNNPDGAKK